MSIFVPRRRGGITAVVPVAVALTASPVSATNGTTYTFSSQSLGVAAADRKIIVGTGGSAIDLSVNAGSSVTIGGVSATVVVRSDHYNVAHYMSEIWQADVPTGTTGDVVVVWNGTGVVSCGAAVYRMTGAGTGPTAANDTDTSEVDPGAMSINVLANGAAVGYASTNLDVAYTWTGLTEDMDEEMESLQAQHSSASLLFAADATLAVVANPAGSSRMSAACASWGPA